MLVSIALLIGGGWTLYVFNFQLQVENSRTKLAKLNREITEAPRLELDITVQQLNNISKASNHHYFKCRLIVKNVGTKSTVIKFNVNTIRLYRVKLNEQGQATWSLVQNIVIPVSDDNQERLHSLGVYIGATNHTSWVIDVDSPGLYVLDVAADRSPSEIAHAVAAGVPPNAKMSWAATHYFMVK